MNLLRLPRALWRTLRVLAQVASGWWTIVFLFPRLGQPSAALCGCERAHLDLLLGLKCIDALTQPGGVVGSLLLVGHVEPAHILEPLA